MAMHGPKPNARSARRRGRQQHRRVGDESAVAQEVMLVEHETFPTQLFGQLDLLEDLLVINVVGRIELRVISGQDIDVETHDPSLSEKTLTPAKTRRRQGDGPRPVIPSDARHLRRFLPSVEMTLPGLACGVLTR